MPIATARASRSATARTTVTFEFDDQTVGDGVQAGHEAIVFDPSDSSVVMARRIRDAINAAADQGRLNVRASSSDGVYAGPSSTSNQVHLSGAARVTMEPAGRQRGRRAAGSRVE